MLNGSFIQCVPVGSSLDSVSVSHAQTSTTPSAAYACSYIFLSIFLLFLTFDVCFFLAESVCHRSLKA